MSVLNIFLGTDVYESFKGDILAVDKSALFLLNNDIKNFKAIGDFDSCSKSDFERIKNNCEVLKFECEKAQTDFELALLYAKRSGYEKVIVHNINCGSRLDHLLFNFKLIYNYRQCFELIVSDRYNYMFFIDQDTKLVDLGYKYISFLNLDDIDEISLFNFRYELTNKFISKSDTSLVSNEFKNGFGTIKTDKEIFVIYSSDRL